jgi:HEAT repeat protein
MRPAVVLLVLISARCSAPSGESDPPLFEAIARRRAMYDAALDSQEAFRVEAEAAALGRLARERFEEILPGLESADPAKQEAAAFALGFSRSRAAMQPLAAAAGSPNPALRAFAIAALGMLGFRDAPQEPFRKLLADDAWQVRHSALFGLRHCAGPACPAPLLEAVCACLSDPLMGIRNEAVLVLAKVASPAALEMILARAVKDPEALVRQNAARALGAIARPAERIRPTLADLLRDEDRGVAEAADAALRWIDGARVDTPPERR